MNQTTLKVAVLVVSVHLCSCVGAIGQLPQHSTVFLRQKARFEPGPQTVAAVFYEVPGMTAGFILQDQQGRRLGSASENLISVLDLTGLRDVTGDGRPEVVLAGGLAAKVVQATFFRYQDHRLTQIAKFGGFSVELVRLRGRPLIAVRQYEYGTLPDLYEWQTDRFVKANSSFPEYYRAEISAQTGTLNGSARLPAYVYAQACRLAAQGLVYGRRYAEAEAVCHKALSVVHTPGRVIPNQIGGGEEVLKADQKKADEQIEATLERIGKVRQTGSNQLDE